MKWFVTDAQLAAMRQEIAEDMRDALQTALDASVKRYDAEILRLREDREKELARLVDPQAPFIADLREQVAYWRRQFQHERQRAEIAIDQCRVTHAQVGPVTLPLREEGARDPMALFQTNPELAMMGSTDGV
jgi:hypothetical protein